MSEIATLTTATQALTDALAAVQDPSVPIEDRAALYEPLYRLQLKVNRALRAAKDDLIVHMEREGLRAMGALSVKSTAIDVRWPCNDPENFGDYGLQDAMAALAKTAPDYVRHVPDHFEIDTAALGAGVAAGDPVARELHAECKRRGWRTEEGRRLSLAVREAKKAKAAA